MAVNDNADDNILLYLGRVISQADLRLSCSLLVRITEISEKSIFVDQD